MQNWEIPSDLKELHEYIKRMESRDSWKQTYYPPDKVCCLVPGEQPKSPVVCA